MPRAAIQILHALSLTPGRSATYRGLRELLGLSTDSGVRQAVRVARRAGFVSVRVAGGQGRGAKAIVKLTTEARQLLARLNNRKDAHAHR